uniref:Uncharacterized protein n=1 Tax=Anthurium amnicola TaxID=1678845 RepID=A0A1D1XV67_9ARAE
MIPTPTQVQAWAPTQTSHFESSSVGKHLYCPSYVKECLIFPIAGTRGRNRIHNYVEYLLLDLTSLLTTRVFGLVYFFIIIEVVAEGETSSSIEAACSCLIEDVGHR